MDGDSALGEKTLLWDMDQGHPEKGRRVRRKKWVEVEGEVAGVGEEERELG